MFSTGITQNSSISIHVRWWQNKNSNKAMVISAVVDTKFDEFTIISGNLCVMRNM